MNLLVDSIQRAKENRDRVAADRVNQPYYWWEFPDPFINKATPQPVSNPRGLARSKQELKRRLGKE